MTVFVNFHLHQIQNCFGQIKKMKDEIFSFQLKKNYFCQTFTDDARFKNVPPLLYLTKILELYHKRNDGRKFPEKQQQSIPREINHAAWLVKNGKTFFSKLMQKISQLTRGEELRRQASKWISPLRQILFILLDNYFSDVC